MSKNFLGIAISTSSIPRGYPGCSNLNSPLTPRRTPRSATYPHRPPPIPYRDIGDASIPAPQSSSSSPGLAAAPRKVRPDHHRPSSIDTTSSDSSVSNSPTERSSFLPRSPALVTPSLLPSCREDANKLGTFSAINIILGKTVGVGIYSVPSSIYANVGSVGMALVVWILGATISFCGLAVYLDLGTALPKSGGEKVYLERIFRKPKYLATCVLLAYVVLLGFSTPNCMVLGEYLVYALGIEANSWNVRFIAVLAITVSCVIHARSPKLGLHLINILGVIKMFIIASIVLSGIASIPMGLGRTSPTSTTFSRNFSSLFEGTSTQPYALATAILKSLYCFRGYNTANQVLSEVRRPVKTLSVAAPIALSIVSAAYLLVNAAYFCAVDKSTFASSGLVVAGHFFTNIFGVVVGARVLPFLIILSAFGSIAATSFAQARVNQELAREKLLPFSGFWASSSPWGTPAAALFLHWLVSVAVIVIPPPGQIYNFLVEIGGYPVSVISVFISGGLLYLQTTPSEKWQSPRPASKVATILFLLSNVVLLIMPWIRPEGGRGGEGRFPYYAYPATGLGILMLGVLYWIWWARIRDWWFGVEEKIIRGAIVGGDLALKDWKRAVIGESRS